MYSSYYIASEPAGTSLGEGCNQKKKQLIKMNGTAMKRIRTQTKPSRSSKAMRMRRLKASHHVEGVGAKVKVEEEEGAGGKGPGQKSEVRR